MHCHDSHTTQAKRRIGIEIRTHYTLLFLVTVLFACFISTYSHHAYAKKSGKLQALEFVGGVLKDIGIGLAVNEWTKTKETSIFETVTYSYPDRIETATSRTFFGEHSAKSEIHSIQPKITISSDYIANGGYTTGGIKLKLIVWAANEKFAGKSIQAVRIGETKLHYSLDHNEVVRNFKETIFLDKEIVEKLVQLNAVQDIFITPAYVYDREENIMGWLNITERLDFGSGTFVKGNSYKVSGINQKPLNIDTVLSNQGLKICNVSSSKRIQVAVGYTSMIDWYTKTEGWWPIEQNQCRMFYENHNLSQVGSLYYAAMSENQKWFGNIKQCGDTSSKFTYHWLTPNCSKYLYYRKTTFDSFYKKIIRISDNNQTRG